MLLATKVGTTESDGNGQTDLMPSAANTEPIRPKLQDHHGVLVSWCKERFHLAHPRQNQQLRRQAWLIGRMRGKPPVARRLTGTEMGEQIKRGAP